ncbi:hypothetical protein ATCC90586_011100 [Pythium insidiosum]|nr:hypothetical protein ATCC90586_011100 [Pythium insidiosum]
MKLAVIIALSATVTLAKTILPVCDRPCPDILKEVCGSNGVTYDNACYFRVAKCEMGDAGKDLVIKHDGHCFLRPIPSCDDIVCADVLKPVCGSNDVTYNNACELDVAKCHLGDAGKNLTIKYDGECGEKAKRALRAEIGCDIGCIDVIDPVCGTDLNTYNNECELEVTKCTTKDPTLKLLHKGVCIPCTGRCTEEYAPVCDVNGVTYDNKCYFEMARCSKRDPTIVMLHEGKCVNCNGRCTEEFAPVCASNGVTYDNKCYFEMARCSKRDPSLVIVKEGAC